MLAEMLGGAKRAVRSAIAGPPSSEPVSESVPEPEGSRSGRGSRAMVALLELRRPLRVLAVDLRGSASLANR